MKKILIVILFAYTNIAQASAPQLACQYKIEDNSGESNDTVALDPMPYNIKTTNGKDFGWLKQETNIQKGYQLRIEASYRPPFTKWGDPSVVVTTITAIKTNETTPRVVAKDDALSGVVSSPDELAALENGKTKTTNVLIDTDYTTAIRNHESVPATQIKRVTVICKLQN